MCERNYTYEEKKLINGFKLTNPHVCVYCGKELKGNDIVTVDHKMPVCKGGETVEINLAISCHPCNQEKDDMTVEEYAIYKQKQQELNQKYEVNKLIDDLIEMQTSIMAKSAEINSMLQEVEKEIVSLQQEIMYGNFNACEGFIYTRTLNELLLKREELKISKIGHNHMNALMGNHKKSTIDLKNKINMETNKAQRSFIKMIAIGKCKKKSKTKVVNINMNELAQSAK